MTRTYDNIYPLYAHDPNCGCCHPNDRPYCDCDCHRGPSRGEVAARDAAWNLRTERIPLGEALARGNRPMPVPPPARPAPPPPAPVAVPRRAALAGLPGRQAR